MKLRKRNTYNLEKITSNEIDKERRFLASRSEETLGLLEEQEVGGEGGHVTKLNRAIALEETTRDSKHAMRKSQQKDKNT